MTKNNSIFKRAKSQLKSSVLIYRLRIVQSLFPVVQSYPGCRSENSSDIQTDPEIQAAPDQTDPGCSRLIVSFYPGCQMVCPYMHQTNYFLKCQRINRKQQNRCETFKNDVFGNTNSKFFVKKIQKRNAHRIKISGGWLNGSFVWRRIG